ncbi:MAG: L-fucose:H+ symporter permease [Proteobacteria bacterium]|nr:L-fucose:H+ symporter permease [Pseudomonadota bacterium]
MDGTSSKADRPTLLEKKYVLPFLLVTTLFFSWALAAQLNDILIRQFQKALELSRGQAAFIQTAFYCGYFFGAIPAGLAMKRFGYKNGILIGLTLYCGGALMFYPAAGMRVFGVFLAALYIIAFGLAFLETAANPYVSVMGDPRTGPARLNIAQSFYGIGAFVGPFLGSIFIFSGIEYTPDEIAAMSSADLEAWRSAEAKTVQQPYLWLASCIAVIFALIASSKFPKITEAGGDSTDDKKARIRDLFKHRHLMLAALTQFFYVGTQVCIWSFFIDFTKDLSPDTTEKAAGQLLSFGFIALMIGRFSGGFIMQKIAPNRLLGGYAIANIVLLAVAMAAPGWTAIWALWLTTFFMSIMWPTVFALGVRDLGPLTKLGSSFMIMAIVGGAFFPPIMGYVADLSGDIQTSLVVPMVGFFWVLHYAVRGFRTAKTEPADSWEVQSEGTPLPT